ncbi:MAG: hypothetical protein QOD09_3052 [Bradyrhizobium sp.]|jgi:hypothetical protein|nr:hypothetical protein [Bradyrhizobium sp.]
MSLIVLIPVILLGIVGALCFAGCVLQTGGLATPFNDYTNGTVRGETSLMVFWPLNDKLKETDNPAPAIEIQSNIPSSYIDMATAPELYPWLGTPVGNPPGPDVASADAGNGSILFNQPGIVAGDAVDPANPSALQPCVVVNGCYVEAPFNPKFVPLGSFTAEAWVRVGWSSTDTHAWRFVLDMRDANPGRGFGILARAEDNQPGVYRWVAMVGNGAAGSAGVTSVPSIDTIALTDGATPVKPVYLALTFDGKAMTLFVDGESQGSMDVAYMPNTAQPIWIGAGAPFVAKRPGGIGPLFPWVGALQDVAIYGAALDATAIRKHFNNGQGIDPPQE